MALQDIMGALGNTPGYNTQLPRFSPESQNLQNLAINQASGRLNKLDQNIPQFGPIAQKAMTQFHQQTVPSIAERFTRMGAQGSGAFARNLGSAGADLQESLAAMEQGFNERQQGRNDNLLAMLLSAGLQPSFENIYTPPQAGFGTTAAQYGLPVLGDLLGKYLQGRSAQSQSTGLGGTLGGAAGSVYGPAGAAAGSVAGTGIEGLINYLLNRSSQPSPAPSYLSQFRLQIPLQA